MDTPYYEHHDDTNNVPQHLHDDSAPTTNTNIDEGITTPWSFADTNKPRQLSRDKSIHATDEVFNSMSHMAAAMLSLLGTVLLIVQSNGNAWKIVSFSIYGTSLIFLFVCSTLHHAINSTVEVSIVCLFEWYVFERSISQLN